jgi:Ca2+-binding EF-hand superfamily protein
LELCRELIIEFASYGPLKRACLCLIALHAPPIKILTQIENIFDFVDANGNGYIEEDDLRTLFGAEKAHDLFLKLDLTQDGRINFSEFLAATEVNRALSLMEPAFLKPGVPVNRGVSGVDVTGSLRRGSTIPGVPQDLINVYEAIVDSVFRKLDVDNTKKISHANLMSLFGRKGYQGSKVPDMIKEGDYTGDGMIAKEEFFTMLFSSKSAIDMNGANLN